MVIVGEGRVQVLDPNVAQVLDQYQVLDPVPTLDLDHVAPLALGQDRDRAALDPLESEPDHQGVDQGVHMGLEGEEVIV